VRIARKVHVLQAMLLNQLLEEVVRGDARRVPYITWRQQPKAVSLLPLYRMERERARSYRKS